MLPASSLALGGCLQRVAPAGIDRRAALRIRTPWVQLGIGGLLLAAAVGGVAGIVGWVVGGP